VPTAACFSILRLVRERSVNRESRSLFRPEMPNRVPRLIFPWTWISSGNDGKIKVHSHRTTPRFQFSEGCLSRPWRRNARVDLAWRFSARRYIREMPAIVSLSVSSSFPPSSASSLRHFTTFKQCREFLRRGQHSHGAILSPVTRPARNISQAAEIPLAAPARNRGCVHPAGGWIIPRRPSLGGGGGGGGWQRTAIRAERPSGSIHLTPLSRSFHRDARTHTCSERCASMQARRSPIGRCFVMQGGGRAAG